MKYRLHKYPLAVMLAVVFLLIVSLAMTVPVHAAELSPTDEATAPPNTATARTVPEDATPPYNSTGTLTENLRQQADEQGGMQFVTFSTASGKVFYLVIDHDKTTENVFLLTEVGEYDLLNFAEAEAIANDLTGMPGTPNGKPQPTPTTTAKPDDTPAKNNNIGLIVVVIAVLGVGGAAFYFFKSRSGKNKPFAQTSDFGFEDEEDYDEPTVNEDNMTEEQDDDE